MKVHITNLYGMAESSTVIMAQNAVQEIAAGLGYKELGIYFYHATQETVEKRSRRLDGILASVSTGDVVIFQSPTWNGIEFDGEFLRKLKVLQAKIVIFIHDVIPYMFTQNANLLLDYMSMYNMADAIIVPSQKMKEKLIADGLNVSKIFIQQMWDHPHHLHLYQPQFIKRLLFAGSLKRFPDLKQWSHSVPLEVFSDDMAEELGRNLSIKGWMKDEEMLLELSKGGFGLVWGTDKNEEENSDYYSMNVSYKLSSYLAAGIPVIIPPFLSNAELIVEQGLGFIANSLEEANEIVENMTQEVYEQLCRRVKYVSFLLSQGYFAKKFLVEAVFDLGFLDKGKQSKSLNLLTITNSQELEQIEYLVNALPQHHFHIAAKTEMGPRLVNLQGLSNVHLYQGATPHQMQALKEQADLYLDINEGGEVDQTLTDMSRLETPIFSFYKTQNGEHGQYLYALSRVEEMVDAIEEFAVNGNISKKALDFYVQSIDETLDYILQNGSSIARFGDGEVALMLGDSINYQEYDANLAQELATIFNHQSDERFVVGLQAGLHHRFEFTPDALAFWRKYLEDYGYFYGDHCKNSWYGATFISRPYIDFIDKSQAPAQFEKLKSIWRGKDILIVEGNTSRSGVGNDLFDGANSVKRIICPSRHAYRKKNEIEQAILEHAENRLILLMLGPTAKVLAWNLSKQGYQALDIGHVDSEYEWMKMGVTEKVKFAHKHTAEFNLDQDIDLLNDETYNSQIIVNLAE